MSNDQFSGSPADPLRKSGSPDPASPPAGPSGTTGGYTPADPGAPLAGTPTADRSRPSVGDRANAVVKKVVIGLIIAALVVVTYFILEAFLPRWWAGQIGDRVDGSFSRGVGTGLVIGFVCTFVPVILLVFAFVSRARLRNVPTIVLAVLAIVVAIPNLLTLAVVAGGGNGAHAGERIFDVDAPGFRAASLWGVIAGVVLAVVVGYFIWRYRRRGRQLRESRERTDA